MEEKARTKFECKRQGRFGLRDKFSVRRGSERKIGDVVKYNAKSVVPHLDEHEAPIPDTWVKLFDTVGTRLSTLT